jgi:hypothetical protein
LDEEITELESVISDITNFDFTPYEWGIYIIRLNVL